MTDALSRSSTCSTKGCRARSLWYPAVKVWAKGWNKRNSWPMEIEVGLTFCEVHKNEFRLEDIPGLPNLARLTTKAMRKSAPDMSTAEIEMRPLILA